MIIRCNTSNYQKCRVFFCIYYPQMLLLQIIFSQTHPLGASFSELVYLFIPHVLSSFVLLYFSKSNTLSFLFLCLFLCFFYILLSTVNALCRRNSLPDPIGHACSTKICFLLKESYRVNKYGNVCVHSCIKTSCILWNPCIFLLCLLACLPFCKSR